MPNPGWIIEGDIDLRSFFAVDESVWPGFREIRGTVTLRSPASADDLERLRDHVDAHCLVRDLVPNATPRALALRVDERG